MAGRKKSGKHRAAPDPRAATIGARIRELRKAQDFTFDAFVEECGLGRGYVSELERGLSVPTVATLDKVASALGVTAADLVAGDSPREQLFIGARDLDDDQLGRLVALLDELTSEG